MKRIVYGLICFSTFLSGGLRVQKGDAVLMTALAQAEIELANSDLKPQELRHLAEYLEFYASWYAAVTPASAALYDSLSPQALHVVERLKLLARPLERKKTESRRMGASRLTENGRLFYQRVITMVQRKIAGCCSV